MRRKPWVVESWLGTYQFTKPFITHSVTQRVLKKVQNKSLELLEGEKTYCYLEDMLSENAKSTREVLEGGKVKKEEKKFISVRNGISYAVYALVFSSNQSIHLKTYQFELAFLRDVIWASFNINTQKEKR